MGGRRGARRSGRSRSCYRGDRRVVVGTASWSSLVVVFIVVVSLGVDCPRDRRRSRYRGSCTVRHGRSGARRGRRGDDVVVEVVVGVVVVVMGVVVISAW